MHQDTVHANAAKLDSLEVEICNRDILARKLDASSVETAKLPCDKKKRRQESSSSRFNGLLSPRISMYDCPFLVQLLSSIRRRANCKRIANYSFGNLYCIQVNRSLHPWNSTVLANAVHSSYIHRYCILSSATAIGALDRISHIPKRPQLPSTKASTNGYRYCLLDLLQDKGGAFGRRSIGSPITRNQTRKRELKALIPYPSQTNIVQKMRNTYQFALLVAMRMSQEPNSDRDMFPEKRKAPGGDPPLDSNESEPQKRRRSGTANFSKNTGLKTNGPSKRPIATNASFPMGVSPKRSRILPTLTCTNDIGTESNVGSREAATAKELSLLERFGLAPKTDQDKASTTTLSSSPSSARLGKPKKFVRRSRPDIPAPPLRCDSPSALDVELKARSRNLAMQRARHLVDTTSNLKANMAPSVKSSQESLQLRTKNTSQIHDILPTRDDHETQSHGNTQRQQENVHSPIHPLASKESQSFSATSISQSPKFSQAQPLADKHVFGTVSSNPKLEKSMKERKHARRMAKKLKKAKKKRKKMTKKRIEYETIRQASDFHVGAIDPTGEKHTVKGEERKLPVVKSKRDEAVRLNDHPPLYNKDGVLSNGSQKNSSVAANDDSTHDSDSLVLLCSESFLETWGEAAGKLISGDWSPDCHAEEAFELKSTRPASMKICLFDTFLVDMCGVDLETPDGGGIIVSSLSSWRNGGFHSLIERIVDLISASKYRYLDVFLCADIDQDDAATNNIVALQNAALHQCTDLATTVSISIVCPGSLATSIGYSVQALQSSQKLEEIETWVSDDRTFERIHFLLSLIPTLTTTSILFCLQSSSLTKGNQTDRSRLWFQKLFGKSDSERQRIQGMRSVCLHPAAMTQLSFTLRLNLGT